MKYFFCLLGLCLLFSCQRKIVERAQYFPQSGSIVSTVPAKEKVWVFLLAGQSNMAGRGQVEPKDTVSNPRILSINQAGQLVLAKEPLHFYEPTLTGLDCGLSFGKSLIKKIPDDVSILLLPTAIGGSAIEQWLGDSLYRNVHLLSNFKEKVKIGQQYGQIKAILWHQGESNANEKGIPKHQERLAELFTAFRTIVGDASLPVLLGELGAYSNNNDNWQSINQAIRAYAASDPHAAVISTADLKNKGDHIHFNSKGQRTIGQRFAEAYLKIDPA